MRKTMRKGAILHIHESSQRSLSAVASIEIAHSDYKRSSQETNEARAESKLRRNHDSELEVNYYNDEEPTPEGTNEITGKVPFESHTKTMDSANTPGLATKR